MLRRATSTASAWIAAAGRQALEDFLVRGGYARGRSVAAGAQRERCRGERDEGERHGDAPAREKGRFGHAARRIAQTGIVRQWRAQ
jgi:hypothetical protein